MCALARPRLIHGRIVGPVWVWLSFLFGPSLLVTIARGDEPPGPDKRVERLRNLWNSQRTQLTAVRAEGCEFFGVVPPESKLTRDDLVRS